MSKYFFLEIEKKKLSFMSITGKFVLHQKVLSDNIITFQKSEKQIFRKCFEI